MTDTTTWKYYQAAKCAQCGELLLNATIVQLREHVCAPSSGERRDAPESSLLSSDATQEPTK